MPIMAKITHKKGAQAKKNKHKGKKKANKASSTAYSVKCASTKPAITMCKPGEKLVKLLKSPTGHQQEIHSVKVTSEVLEHITPQEFRDLRSVFEIFDLDSNGLLGPRDLCRALKSLGFKISRAEAEQMVHNMNFEGRMELNFSEFLEVVMNRPDEGRDTFDEIMKGFHKFDLGATGSISAEKLGQVCRCAGVKLTQEELEGVIDEADVNGDKNVDQTEFLKIMLRTNLF